MKSEFYNMKNILTRNAKYNVIFGERSNGKSFAVKEYAINRYAKKGEQFAIVRRWTDDFTGKRGTQMFEDLCKLDVVTKATNGEWTDIYYYGSRWYFCRWEDGKRIVSEDIFAFGFSLTAMEHDKSISFPRITTILFDEFLSRSGYLPDEFVTCMNVFSTIIRQRNNVTIFMCGNTVNPYCPYFKEMGLRHVKQMKPGDIDTYTYGDSGLTVAVEYTLPNIKGKPSDVYFAFDNPKLSMITGGEWEIGIYPHCPVKFLPKEIMFTYFIIYDEQILQCEVVQHDNMGFTFIHPKTTPLKDENTDLIYSTDYDPRPNWKRKITKPTSKIEDKIAMYYRKDKIFYSDNETGETVRNYLMWCGKVM